MEERHKKTDTSRQCRIARFVWIRMVIYKFLESNRIEIMKAPSGAPCRDVCDSNGLTSSGTTAGMSALASAYVIFDDV